MPTAQKPRITSLFTATPLQYAVVDIEKSQSYRVVSKCQAGWLVVSELEAASPADVVRRYQPKALMTVEVKDAAGYFHTIYARTVKAVKIIDLAILDELKPSISSYFHHTQLPTLVYSKQI